MSRRGKNPLQKNSDKPDKMLSLQLQRQLIVALVLLVLLLLLLCVAKLQTERESLRLLAAWSASLSDLCPLLLWLRGQRSEAGVRADHLRVTVMMMNAYILLPPLLSFKNSFHFSLRVTDLGRPLVTSL